MIWLPIETAPKDGTYVLLHGGDNKPWTTCGHWDDKFSPQFNDDPEAPQYRAAWTDDTVASWQYEESTELCPRFWMPLPPLPTTLPQAKGEFGEPWETDGMEIWDRNSKTVTRKVRIVQCVNLLAGHDLTKVVVVAKSMMKEVESAVRIINSDAHFINLKWLEDKGPSAADAVANIRKVASEALAKLMGGAAP